MDDPTSPYPASGGRLWPRPVAVAREFLAYDAAGKRVVRDERAAAEAEQWLSENEDATAMTPERMAALEAQAVELSEADSPVAGRRFTRA